MTEAHPRRRRKDESAAEQARQMQMNELQLDAALALVREGKAPRIDPSDHMDVMEIENPYHDPSDSRGVQKRMMVGVVRPDHIARMARRGYFSTARDAGAKASETALRLEAARRIQNLYERAEIGGARGIDPSKDVVDGGRFHEPNSDSRLRAEDEIRGTHAILGKIDAAIVWCVIGKCWTIKETAAALGNDSAEALRLTGGRFRQALDTLAVHFGIANAPKRFRTPRDSYAEYSRYADNPELHRAMRLARR